MKIFLQDSDTSAVVEIDESAVLADSIALAEDEELWEEDADETLARGATAAQLARRGLHRGRHRVDVRVHYNGDERERRFAPGTTIERVHRWVVGHDGFNLNPADAGDLVLRETGSTDELDVGAHVGRLAGRDHKLDLDLVVADRFAG
ncbi:hypothetical protein [Cellulomonas sp. KRMCY2]|uniref:hypothetical protein n=1 Tax=Cellulomonas sp. KRMCY2 TaxID=1304865 RepID=UPI00045E8CAA|nr:hypothetical protein [Cellulomonas sp. KRMCY2]